MGSHSAIAGGPPTGGPFWFTAPSSRTTRESQRIFAARRLVCRNQRAPERVRPLALASVCSPTSAAGARFQRNRPDEISFIFVRTIPAIPILRILPTDALVGPDNSACQAPQASLADWLGAVDGFEKEDVFLDVGSEEGEVEELGDAGAGEAEAASQVGAVAVVAAIDGGL